MKKGRSWRQPECQVKILPNGLEFSRFGIIVSNKVAKKANVRNLLKRQIRSYLREQALLIRPGFDVVLMAYTPILVLDYAGRTAVVAKALDRLSMIIKVAK